MAGQTPIRRGIEGKLADTSYHLALANATIMLLKTDSSVYKVLPAQKDGSFIINHIPAGNYILVASCIGYKSRTLNIRMPGTASMLKLGMLYMEVNRQALAGVVVTLPLIRITGDTTEFDATQFKTKPNALLEDLLKKIPGFNLFKDGTLVAQGEEVKRILIDGRPYFGDNIRMSTQNIPSELVGKVQVFDAKSEQSKFNGFNDGSTVKTVNIVTKPNRRSGEFGNPEIGAGTDNRFSASLNLNSFKGKQRISVTGQGNNINRQYFSAGEIVSAIRNGNGGMFAGLSDAQLFGKLANISSQFSPPPGIINTWAGGINFNDAPGERTIINGSYFYNKNNIENRTEDIKTYLVPGNAATIQTGINASNSHTESHNLVLELEQQLDSANSFSFKPSFNINESQSISEINSAASSQDMTINTLNSTIAGSGKANQLKNSILFRHRFNKAGKTLSLELTQEINHSHSNLQTLNLYGHLNNATALPPDTLNQHSETDVQHSDWGAHLSFTTMLNKIAGMEFRYDARLSNTASGLATMLFNGGTGKYDLPDSLQSSSYRNQIIAGCYTANVQLTLSKRLNAQIGMGIQKTDLSGIVNGTPGKTEQTFLAPLPALTVQYHKARNQSLRLNFRTTTTDPTARQLQNVLDYSNPTVIYRGNAFLKQQLSYNSTATYTYFNTRNYNNFKANVNVSFTKHKISNSAFINSSTGPVLFNGVIINPGMQYETPVNLEGAYKIAAFATAGINTGKAARFLFNTSFSGQRDLFIINGIDGKVYRTSIIQTIKYTMNINERLELALSGNSGYNWVKYITGNNTASFAPQANYFTQVVSFEHSYHTKSGWIAGSDISYILTSGQAGSYNQSTLLLNAKLARLLLKKKQLELSLSANDLLNQNRNITRTADPTFVETANTLVLKRYFLLSVTYHFSRF